MITRVFYVLFFMALTPSLFAQESPVKWDYNFVLDKEQNAIIITATIDEGWYLYSVDTPEGGPIPTVVTFKDHDDVAFYGKVLEDGALIVEQSSLFELEVHKYKNTVSFIQAIYTEEPRSVVTGTVRFMTCDGQRCMAPKTIPFSINVNLDQ